MIIDNAYFNFPDFYRQVASTTEWSKFVEVGVYTGASICFLAQELKKRGTPFSLYAVDLWENAGATGYTDLEMTVDVWETFKARMAATGTTSDILVRKTDSISAANEFEDGSLDFVFIDANHEYKAAKPDILAWLPKIKRSGAIGGHDILEKSCGVEQAVREIFGNRYSIVNNCWIVPRGTMP
jgi:predicted O-methyltransferase YrrM